MQIFNKNKKNIGRKEKELKTDSIQRVLRSIFWVLLVFLVIKSIANDVFEKEEEFEIPEIKLEQQQPAAVAASFAKEYLTYSVEESMEETKDYRERLYKFAADYLKFNSLSNVNANSKVENIFVFSVKKITDNQYNVLVKADVQYSFTDGKRIFDSIYLEIPVNGQDGQYVVEDTPVIIPEPEKADIDYSRFNQGEELYITESNKVKEIMSNFFNTYCTGKPTEIAYYMDDGKPLKGFEGRFAFLYIKEFHVFDLKVDNKYKATAMVALKDTVSSKEFLQNYNIDLVKREGRWYIKKINIRGGNINEKYKNEENQK